MSAQERYTRHTEFFGAEGQQRLSATVAAIVGLGGLGSHLAQQLGYLGVGEFLLIDADTVEISNLNRLIGAGPADVGLAKVDVTARMLHTIRPDVRVQQLREHFEPDTRTDQLAGADVVFGCLDADAARLDLLRYASAHAIAYIDLASDIVAGGEFGGRVVFAKDGERCLSCLGELDQHALARTRMSDEQRRADDAIYGVERAALRDSGPSVVSINGVVASLAVTEFVVWRTGLREPAGFLNYRGDLGTVSRRADVAREYCAYCMTGWGSALAPRSSSAG